MRTFDYQPIALRAAILVAAMAMAAPNALAQGSAPGGAAASGPASNSSATTSPGSGGSAPASQHSVTLNLPEAGPKFARILPSADAKQQAQLPIDFSDKKVTIPFDPAYVGKSPRIAVDDVKTGNTAVKAIPESNEVTLLHPDFDRVHVVDVKVMYDSKPVQVARVTLEPFDKASQSKVIDSSMLGVAVFNDVVAGKAKLNIVYGDNLTQTQDIVITTDHPATGFVVPVSVSNKVPTLDQAGGGAVGAAGAAGAVGPQATGGAATAPPAGLGISPTTNGPIAPSTPSDSGSGVAGFVGQVLAIAVVGGGIYLFWKWFQSGGFAATMKKIGIELSGPTPPSDAGTPWQPNVPAAPIIADPSVCQFCGQKRDAAGNCACALTGGAAGGSSGAPISVIIPSPAVAAQPRLVATMGVYSGSIFALNINGTGVTLGRDTTNSIPLDNDTTVSRRHASIRSENGAYLVSDEGSSNGVYLNGVRISGSQALRAGDEVQIGNTCFRFEL